MRYFAGFMCALTLFACSSETSTTELEQFLDEYISERTVDESGVAVALIGPGGIELEKGYGMANIEEADPVGSDTVFNLASVSKQFTAAAIMVLYEEGKVDPGDRVTETFPEAPAEWESMTVHHLLTHQSGLSGISSRGLNNDEVLTRLLEAPLDFAPGDDFQYTNSSYVVLAILIERVTGEPFEDFLRERIFEPIGMRDSVVTEDAPPDVPNLAQPYLMGVTYEYSESMMGASNQYSTLADMIQWELSIRNASLLSPDTLALVFTRHVEIPEERRISDNEDCGYGYGWFICTVEADLLQHHGGRGLAFRTFIDRVPAENLTVIMLSNGSHEWTYDIGPALWEFYVNGGEASP